MVLLWDTRIAVGQSSAEVYGEDGSVLTFSRTGTAWTGPASGRAILTDGPSGTLVLRLPTTDALRLTPKDI